MKQGRIRIKPSLSGLEASTPYYDHSGQGHLHLVATSNAQALIDRVSGYLPEDATELIGQAYDYAEECHAGSFIGTDFQIHQDLTGELPERWQEFNERFRQEWMENNPGKTKVAAGLACGALWTVSKGILEGDIVLCPNGQGIYLIGEVVGPYYYSEGGILHHRRPVR